MIKHYCEMCHEELPESLLPFEEFNETYWKVLLERSRSDRNAKDRWHYHEVCDECVEHLQKVIAKFGGYDEQGVDVDSPTP